MSSSLNIPTGQYHQLDVMLTPSNAAETSRTQLENPAFAVSVCLIAASSIYDAFLVFRHRNGISEQNPICDWLIKLEPEYVSVFLLAKGFGTLVVVAILIGLFKYWRRVAIPVAVSLVLFQAGLMSYLHGTDGREKPINRRTLAQLGQPTATSSFTNEARKGSRAGHARFKRHGRGFRFAASRRRLRWANQTPTFPVGR